MMWGIRFNETREWLGYGDYRSHVWDGGINCVSGVESINTMGDGRATISDAIEMSSKSVMLRVLISYCNFVYGSVHGGISCINGTNGLNSGVFTYATRSLHS